MPTIINSRSDLFQWVCDHSDPFFSMAELRQIAEAINLQGETPRFGEDWTEFLDSLPDMCLLLPQEI